MQPTDAQLQVLRDLFERYRALPRHQKDSDFLERLQSLQQWEIVDLRRRHAHACSQRSDYARVLDYYLSDLHNGLPLDGMIARGPEGLNHAKRMDKAFPLFASTIEYSVLSTALQDQIASRLNDQPLTAATYAEVLQACDDMPDRLKRLDLLAEIGQICAPHIHSRMIYTGFKLLKGMFRTVGLGEIHTVLDSGFRQLRDVSRLAQILAEIAEVERQQLRAVISKSR